MTGPTRAAVYGLPPSDLAAVPDGAVQLSPFHPPDAADLADLPPDGLDRVVVLAPPGTVERRGVLAGALRALRPGGELIALAPKARGGSRLRGELDAFGCAVEEEARRHHRICRVLRPEEPAGLAEAIAESGPRLLPELGLVTQPGIFSWDRVDAGTALLLAHLPALSGRVADLGCGLGLIGRALLAGPGVAQATLVDLDRRAVACARLNVADPRATILWADARRVGLTGLDAVVMNPPFHAAGAEDVELGRAFIAAAAGMLRKGGTLRLVANRHLPYEATLRERFRRVEPVADSGGFKVYGATA